MLIAMSKSPSQIGLHNYMKEDSKPAIIVILLSSSYSKFAHTSAFYNDD